MDRNIFLIKCRTSIVRRREAQRKKKEKWKTKHKFHFYTFVYSLYLASSRLWIWHRECDGRCVDKTHKTYINTSQVSSAIALIFDLASINSRGRAIKFRRQKALVICRIVCVCVHQIDGDALRFAHAYIWNGMQLLLFSSENGVTNTENGDEKKIESTELKWARFIVCRTKIHTTQTKHNPVIQYVPAIGSFFRNLSRASIYERKHYPTNAHTHTHTPCLLLSTETYETFSSFRSNVFPFVDIFLRDIANLIYNVSLHLVSPYGWVSSNLNKK